VATTIIDPFNRPIEIAPGRGDLRRTSLPFSAYATGNASLIGGRTVSYADLVESQPLIGMAVMRMLTWASRVPLKAYLRTGDDSRERLRAGDPLADALLEPWDRGSSLQLIMALLGPLLVHGNSVLRIDDGARGRFRFAPADYRYSRPIFAFRDSISGWDFDVDDPKMMDTRPADQVLHVAWWSATGPLGVSPLKMLGTTIAVEDAAMRHQQAMWRNGVRSPTVIESLPEYAGLSESFQTLMMEQLRGDIDELHAGPDQSGRPLLLPPGLSAKPMGYTSVEAQLVEQRLVGREEVGGVLQLPPGCLGFMREGSDAMAEQRQMGYQDGLAPPLLLIESALNAQIIRSLLRERDKYVEFDFAALLKGDKLREVEAMREQISYAMLTPNEARSINNMPQSDEKGMDSFFLPRNNLVEISVPYDGVPKGASANADDE
jgi:HK97 family phage portal protein